MSNIWFISDIHAGHKNQTRWRTGFESEEQVFKTVEKNYHNKVGKRDHVYFLGDIAFNEARLWEIGGWVGAKKILIVGNHCTEHIPMKTLCEVFDEVHSLYKYKEFWLSHAPIHPDELRNKINIHGHTHHHVIQDKRYVNVCLEQCNYGPISLDEVRYSLRQK